MKITLALVSSLNGLITDGSRQSISAWTSAEDQQHFAALIQHHATIIMGASTYLANAAMIKLVPGKLRVVLTRTPEKYAEQCVPGQLEFSSESPIALVSRLRAQDSTDILVVGGSQVAGLFLDAGLIDELLLTIEPVLFAQGVQMVMLKQGKVSLQLNKVT